MDASVVWKKGMSFTGTGFTSNFSLPLGASPKVGGDNDGFRPLELVLVGLAGCTAMDVISILEKKRQQVTAFEVKAHGDQADEHPRSLTRFEIDYIVTGKGIDREAVERAVELSQTKYCSVAATVRKAGPLETRITIHEG
jgi:putative redox protein